MSNHTPGPWFVSNDEDSPLIYSDTNATYVAQVFARDDGLLGTARGAAVDADARIIAAAPELLKALQMIEEVASGRVPLVNNWVASVARAAISKANGEQA